jgi:curved DNA-binding protein
MEFKDYYAALEVKRDATGDEIKRAYRKLARKYHPDVSKEPNAEARFKDVAEAYEVLKDPERRAAYDAAGQRWTGHEAQQPPPPGWDAGYEFSGDGGGPADAAAHSEFFDALFGRHARAGGSRRSPSGRGSDHHAKVLIDIEDAFAGAVREIGLQMPVIDAQGRVAMQMRRIELRIPKGIVEGQQLRLAGQGGLGFDGGSPGDLYLEVGFRPHPRYRVDGRDLSFELPLAPWEAALGCLVTVPTPSGSIELRVPPGSKAGGRLRIKGKGLPGGDLYAQIAIRLPPADTAARQDAYRNFARAFDFDPRHSLDEVQA